jgi:hypothetical protein
MGKKLTAFLLVILLFCGTCGRVCAIGLPNESQKGEITLALRSENTAVTGGSLGLYRVGDLGENGQVRLKADFRSAALKTDLDLESAALAQALSEEVEKENLTGTVQKVSDRGTVTFENLERGVYLIKQEAASENSGDILPFLVAIPQQVDGTDVYTVDASPKVELKEREVPEPSTKPGTTPAVSQNPGVTPSTAVSQSPGVTPAVSPNPSESPAVSPNTDVTASPEVSPKPSASTEPSVSPEVSPAASTGGVTSPTVSPSTPSSSSGTKGTTLPQTGQLQWPIPFLALGGVMLILIGWRLYYRGKKHGK